MIDCVDCNAGFEISEGEKQFFESKGFDLPKRCSDCRRRKKLEREAEARY